MIYFVVIFNYQIMIYFLTNLDTNIQSKRLLITKIVIINKKL